MQDVPRLPQPSRTLVIPLLAAALGAGVATATFAVVNIEDQPNISLPAVQSAPSTDALAGQRNDAGPEEGTAQQAMQGSTVAVDPSTAPRYDGGPNEGSADVLTETQPPKLVAPSSEPRYDGGPDEGSSASAIAGR